MQSTVETLRRVHEGKLPFDRTIKVSLTERLTKEQILARMGQSLEFSEAEISGPPSEVLFARALREPLGRKSLAGTMLIVLGPELEMAATVGAVQEMCCACGGGSTRDQQTCKNTNDEALDSDGFGCNYYNNDPESCGLYDTANFVSKDMCCGCGGGRRNDFDPKTA